MQFACLCLLGTPQREQLHSNGQQPTHAHCQAGGFVDIPCQTISVFYFRLPFRALADDQ